MNAGRQPIFVSNQTCDCTVTQVTNQLNQAGYSVIRSFDLLSAINSGSTCLCQMVVLLVYGQDGPPVTLIVSGNNLSTIVFLENDPDRSTRPKFTNLLSKISMISQADEAARDQTTKFNTSPDH